MLTPRDPPETKRSLRDEGETRWHRGPLCRFTAPGWGRRGSRHAPFPPAIVPGCVGEVFCVGGDGHAGATRPSTAWRRHRVHRRNRDGTPDRILAAITLDIDDITTA